MNNFSHLVRTLSIFISILGLTNCGSDNTSATQSPSPWHLDEPTIKRTDGTSLTFTEAESEVSQYNVTDQIIFRESPGTSLKIHSSCSQNRHIVGETEFSVPMKIKYEFYELLPAEAIFTAATQQDETVTCEIDFVARDHSSNTHHFILKPFPLGTAPQIAPLKIYRSLEPISAAKNQTLSIKRSDFTELTLAPLEDEHFAYRFECLNQTAWIVGPKDHVQLDLFQFADKSNMSPSTGNQFCQVFLVRHQFQTIKMTDPFVLRQGTLLPTGSSSQPNSRAINPLGNGILNFGAFHVSNPTDQEAYIELPTQDELKGIITFVVKKGGSSLLGMDATINLNAKIIGALTYSFDNRNRFVIPPYGTATVQVSYSYKKFGCSGFDLVGVYYRLSDLTRFYLNVLDEKTAPSQSIHITEKMTLGSSLRQFQYSLVVAIPPPLGIKITIEPKSVPVAPVYSTTVPNKCQW